MGYPHSPVKLAAAIMDINTDHLTPGLVDKLSAGKLYPVATLPLARMRRKVGGANLAMI